MEIDGNRWRMDAFGGHQRLFHASAPAADLRAAEPGLGDGRAGAAVQRCLGRSEVARGPGEE